MANPNIVNVTTINGGTTYYTPSSTTAVVLLPNAASSGTVLKINSILATNILGTAAVNATVSLYTNGAVTQGSAPASGTAYPIASTISVPANATLVLLDKSTPLYLLEGISVIIQSSTASGITYTISYETIS
jgi:hypothetical protein